MKKNGARVLIGFLAAVFLAGCMTSKSSQIIDNFVPVMVPPERVANYSRNVVWIAPGGSKLLVDVSGPEGKGPFPVLVWLHGGSWEFFSKEANEGLARYITNRGYVVMNFNYRMVPEVSMKTIVEDALGAVEWAYDHAAEYNGDPQRMAVAGHSAGAHLATMTEVACDEPFFSPTYVSEKGRGCHARAFLPVSGVYDFRKEDAENPEQTERWMGTSLAADSMLYDKCSPVNYPLSRLPATLVLSADKDFLLKDNQQWFELIDQAGVKAELYIEPGVTHLWPTWHWKKPAKQTYDRMIKFLNENLN